MSIEETITYCRSELERLAQMEQALIDQVNAIRGGKKAYEDIIAKLTEAQPVAAAPPPDGGIDVFSKLQPS